MSFKNINRCIGFNLFIVATSTYLITLEPTASFWDSGEFIATSYKLEVPHPPGAPLFMLIGRIFSFLAQGEVENVAWAINSLSAVSSGLAVMFLYWTIVMFGQKLTTYDTSHNKVVVIASGVVGSLAFAFSDSFWNSSIETEVYATSTFLTALVFWCILKWEQQTNESDQNRWLILIFYLLGLSVGIHLLNLLTIPALALVYYFKKCDKISIWKLSATIGISCCILLCILYGLVSSTNVAKHFEIFFVNTLKLPFGSGVITFSLIALGVWIYGVYKTHRRKAAEFNTFLLAIGFVYIGYCSYIIIPIRAGYSTPINQNNPQDIMGLMYYLNMEQYPTRPLLYGRNFSAQLVDQRLGKVLYERGLEKYDVKDHKMEYTYAQRDMTFFPRMYSTYNKAHPDAYREIVGLNANESPTLIDNMQYLLAHQLGHMYLRYFLWNFWGRTGSEQGASWINPLKYSLPDFIKNDKTRNNYYGLPILFGVVGFWFLLYNNKKALITLGTLFVMTGVAIVIYINAPPIEPRERDYVYVGSYYAFCIFIGLGVLGAFRLASKKLKTSKWVALGLVSSISLFVPAIMFVQNFDDHNRTNRYYSVDQAKNMLAECEPNAILFTGGDNDTYPLWYVQEVEGFRTDVRVIVLSYANTDWYIEQLYKPVNESDPLPLSLQPNDYKNGGLNDFLPLVKNERIKAPVSARQYLNLLQKQSKVLQVRSGSRKLNITPTDSFYVSTAIEKVREKIPTKFYALQKEKLQIKLKGSGLQKNDLVILDLIDTNRWERPIYFNYTSLNSINLDLKDNVVVQGITYRLLPIDKKGQPDNLVDEKKMYTNLVERAQWRNTDNSEVYYDDYYQTAMRGQRHYFNQLVQTLLDTGNTEMAKKTLKKSAITFPEETVPYGPESLATADLLLAVHEFDTASQVANQLKEQSIEYLTYAKKESLWEKSKLTQHLLVLRELALIFEKHGLTERGQEYARLFQEHYEQIRS